jgi:hypothetical protein
LKTAADLYTVVHTFNSGPEDFIEDEEDFSILYDSLRGAELNEIAIRAENISGREIETAEIMDQLEQYREWGLLDDDYLPTSTAETMRRQIEDHLQVFGSRERTAEIYSALGQDYGTEVFRGIIHGDYEDMKSMRTPEEAEQMEEALKELQKHGIVAEYISEDGFSYGLTDDGMKLREDLDS